MRRPLLSLKGQALALLSRRDHSRAELRGKLLAHVRKQLRAEAPEESKDPGPEIDALLDWLEAQKYLSDARFIESRVNARASRHGASRIKMELSRLGVALDADTAQQLRSTELERARDVWQRKFAEPAADAAGRAKQARFLAARGFAADVVWRVVGGRDDD